MGNYRGNASGIGTASHPEKHYPDRSTKTAKGRSKYKCIYLDSDKKTCVIMRGVCVNPSNALCTSYREQETHSPAKKVTRIKPASFDGIKYIPLKDIQVTQKYSEPSPQKIQELIKYIQEHREFDKPIVVSCGKAYYILVDKYLRYVVAKRLGLKEIPAVMHTSDQNNCLHSRLRTVGYSFEHQKYGTGVVVRTSLECVEVQFNELEKTIKFRIDMLINSGLITNVSFLK